VDPTVSIINNGVTGQYTYFTAYTENAKVTPTYQWQTSKDAGQTWSNISGATEASYALKISTKNMNNMFRCTLKMDGTKVVTPSAYILEAVATPATILIKQGETAKFTAKCENAMGDIVYQWQYSPYGTSWYSINDTVAGASGYNGKTLKLKTDADTFTRIYRCAVTSTVTGSRYTIYTNTTEVKPLPSVTISIPKAIMGKTITMTATPKNAAGSVTYQWQVSTDKGKTWKNATYTGNKTAKMKVKVTTKTVTYKYRCKIKTGGKKATSKAKTIYAVQVKKSASKVAIGKTVTFTAKAWNTGSGKKFQWQYSRDGGTTWKNCPDKASYKGSKTAKMIVKVTQSNANDKYRCVVSGKNGKMNSNTLYITPKPRYFAVVIANDDFDDDSMDRLGGKYDGTAMKNALTSFGWKVKLVRNATASDMQSAIISQFDGRLPTDTCLVFFSTHGVEDNSYGTAGALAGVDNSLLYPWTLRDTLLNNTRGKVIILISACGSGGTVYNANGSGDSIGFEQGFMNAFSGYVMSDDEELESNTGELRQDRFLVLTSSAHEKSSYNIYITKKEGKAIWHYGSAFCYSIVTGMGCSFPDGKYSGKMPADSNGDKKLTLSELHSYINSSTKKMKSIMTSQPYTWGYDSEGNYVKKYLCYRISGNTWYYSYFEPLDQTSKRYGGKEQVLFKK
jgi:hypothetical protein